MDKLEILGELYCRKYLIRWDDISANWWTAFDFFFDHASMRGRRDELSAEYANFIVAAIKRHFDIPDRPSELEFTKITYHREEFARSLEDIIQFKKTANSRLTSNALKDHPFHDEIARRYSLVHALIKGTRGEGSRPLNNDKDLMMVLSALVFLTRPGMPANIHNYMAGQLREGKAAELARDLEAIHYLGDKLSSFIIRDVILMNPELAIENANLVFPVDTWVQKIAGKLGCVSRNHDEVREFFINSLGGKSPVKIAAGLWYLGFNSLDIVCANLDRIDTACLEAHQEINVPLGDG
ncbi:MAG TPA: hypothetical protein PLP83_05445 [Candidatus Aminicenantes bacterium]|nr:hypothetical protein [Candidatus Aminicenantes bacterium]